MNIFILVVEAEKMTVIIENNKFRAEIDSFGAEIQHFIKKDDGTELIWNGDKSVWGNHAPLLFPFVARCLGGYFLIEGKKCEYTKNHGFARNLDTKVILQEPTKVCFELTDCEDTTYRYPYKFSLVTEYEVTDDGLNWQMTVKNNDTKPFRFGIGTHTAFTAPRNTDAEGTQISDYVVEFENHEALTGVKCTPDGYIITEADGKTPATFVYGEAEKGIIPLTAEGFGNGHLFGNFTSNWVGLRNKKNNSLISIESKGFPYCMIWQNVNGAPQFVCIEPWHGLPDTENTDHIWENKIGLNEIKPGETFVCKQDIRVKF